jgi:dipeptidyl aminopeptidase/acylaminoacyl peptidase
MKIITTLLGLCLFALQGLHAQDVLTPQDLLRLKYVGGQQLSPDGKQMIYMMATPRTANEEPGGSHIHYYLMNMTDKSITKLFEKDFRASGIQWHPDGKHIAFLHKAKGGQSQVYTMLPGEGDIIQVTNSTASIRAFAWAPDGKALAVLIQDPITEREEELKKRGYDFIFYEENIKKNNLYYMPITDGNAGEMKQLTEDVQVWDMVWNNAGTAIAAAISPENLVDHSYMFKKIYAIDISTGQQKQISKNAGKLGNYTFSPDDSKLAYAAALDINDHQISQAFVVDIASGELSNLTPENYRGHIGWVGWKSDNELLYHADEGVNTDLYSHNLKKSKLTLLLDGEEQGIVFQEPQWDAKGKVFVMSGSTPTDYINIYRWKGKGNLERLTDANPVLTERRLAEQRVVTFNARDGQEIEGLVMLPPDYKEGTLYPLIVYVHGGPESHHSNAWLSYYSTPGQVMAGKGYLVAYFNYRASTGYGVAFAKAGLGDPAGKEFDDIADGIDFMIENYGADPERVGLAGGSYGGYASAWFATYYTEKVKAVAMFVGISNLISKKGTTDIPYEEIYVHSGDKLENQWELSLERSPVYHAAKSKTATLIYGGADDTRVHPSQSMELYRRMKVNKHPAVRLVQYPGEGHGNRKQVGRIDVLYRQMSWMDWYVRDAKPIDGPMPPLDISDLYGLDWFF